MFKSEAIFTKAVLGAQNHIARAEEGSLLLANGRSLSEISTPITGLTSEETLERRNDFLEFINQMDEAGLRKHLAMIEHQIDVAISRPIQGTSELYWQRIVILDRL